MLPQNAISDYSARRPARHACGPGPTPVVAREAATGSAATDRAPSRQRAAQDVRDARGSHMPRYPINRPRTALALAAMLLTSITLAALVVLPSKMDPHSAVFTDAAKSPAATATLCDNAVPATRQFEGPTYEDILTRRHTTLSPPSAVSGESGSAPIDRYEDGAPATPHVVPRTFEVHQD